MKKLFSSCSFIGLLLCFSFIACSKKHYPSIDTTVQTDSTTTITERDTNVIAPKASAGLNIPFDNILNLHLNGDSKPFNLGESTNRQAKVKASVITDSQTKQKSLKIDCDCDTLAIQAKIKHKTQVVNKSTIVEKVIVEKQRFIPGFIKFLAWVGGLAIFSLIILIIYHIKLKK